MFACLVQVGETAWKGLVDMALLEEMCYWAESLISESPASPVDSFYPSCLWIRCNLSVTVQGLCLSAW